MTDFQNQRDGRRPGAAALEDLSPDELLQRLDAMQRDLAAMRREANEASELAMLGLLSASTAHELRNVLTPVLSYAQMARSRRSDSALVEKALDRIVSGLKAAATILGGTLDHAGPNRVQPRYVEATVADAVQEVLAMLPRHPSHEGIEVVLEIERGLRAAIEPVALRQVLLNLFLNAISAMSAVPASHAPHRLLVRGRRTAGPLAVSLEVSDTGPGVPAAMVDRLFEPFAASAMPSSGAEQPRFPGSRAGAGLGLSICRRLIDAAGGTIAHDATRNQGASFRIALPAPVATMRKAG